MKSLKQHQQSSPVSHMQSMLALIIVIGYCFLNKVVNKNFKLNAKLLVDAKLNLIKSFLSWYKRNKKKKKRTEFLTDLAFRTPPGLSILSLAGMTEMAGVKPISKLSGCDDNSSQWLHNGFYLSGSKPGLLHVYVWLSFPDGEIALQRII